MEKTWKPTTAGILSIIAGVIAIIVGIVVVTLGTVAGGLLGLIGLPGLSGIVAALVAIPIVLGIVAIIGGIYALRRRIWWLALVGSICSLICVWFLGIPAIIFVAMGKGEFE